jgi:hypothetical protein
MPANNRGFALFLSFAVSRGTVTVAWPRALKYSVPIPTLLANGRNARPPIMEGMPVADKIKLNLEENSPYRVALDLAYTIASHEGKYNSGGDRQYWLELYQRCRKVVVLGASAEFALKESD